MVFYLGISKLALKVAFVGRLSPFILEDKSKSLVAMFLFLFFQCMTEHFVTEEMAKEIEVSFKSYKSVLCNFNPCYLPSPSNLCRKMKIISW